MSGDGTGGGSGAGAADQAAKVIEAIRGDYKQERARRQQLEKDLAALRAAQEQATKDTEARSLALAKTLGLQVDETPDPEKLTANLKAPATSSRPRPTRPAAVSVNSPSNCS
jgi:hypothetical protein